MSVEIVTVSGKDLVTGPFMARWRTDRDRPKELINIKEAASLALRELTKLHVLQIEGRDYGFVAVDIQQFLKVNPNKYYLHVSFLFVSKQYRGKKIDELEGMTAAEYLMSTVFNKSMEVSNFFPFSIIVLFPADKKLIPFYASLGYLMLAKTKGFMFLSLRPEV